MLVYQLKTTVPFHFSEFAHILFTDDTGCLIAQLLNLSLFFSLDKMHYEIRMLNENYNCFDTRIAYKSLEAYFQ